MNTALSTLFLAYVGLMSLALAMDRHQVQAFGKELPRQKNVLLRIAGAGFLVWALVPAIASMDVSVGFSFWTGMLTVAALACALLFSYAPTQAARSLLVAAVVGTAAYVASAV